MKKIVLLFMVSGIALMPGCQKEMKTKQQETVPGTAVNSLPGTASTTSCQPSMYVLSVQASNNCFLYQVTGAPGFLPITVTPVLGSGGTNQLTDCLGNAIKSATGLSYDPGTGTFYGTTGNTGAQANSVLSFTDPNCVTVTAASASCAPAITLNLSDIERDPASGTYYALNRNASSVTIVQVAVPAGTVSCLPNTIPGALHGLTFDCSGQLFVMRSSGTSGITSAADKTTGLITATYPSFRLTPPHFNPFLEAGLHYDCCIGRFITGHQNHTFTPTNPIVMTSNLPAALGGPLYDSVWGVLPRTVDFATP